MKKESKLKMYGKAIGFSLAGLAFSGLVGLTILNIDKKKDLQKRYDNIFINESITLEDTLNFYEKHDLMEYTIFEYNDLMKGEENRWRFLPIPDSVKERIVKEHEEYTLKK